LLVVFDVTYERKAILDFVFWKKYSKAATNCTNFHELRYSIRENS
jgi:hypothetical protein